VEERKKTKGRKGRKRKRTEGRITRKEKIGEEGVRSCAN